MHRSMLYSTRRDTLSEKGLRIDTMSATCDKTGHGDLKSNEDCDKGASNKKLDESVAPVSSSGSASKQPDSNIKKTPCGKHDNFNCYAILQRLSGGMIRNLISPLDRLSNADRIAPSHQGKPQVCYDTGLFTTWQVVTGENIDLHWLESQNRWPIRKRQSIRW